MRSRRLDASTNSLERRLNLQLSLTMKGETRHTLNNSKKKEIYAGIIFLLYYILTFLILTGMMQKC